MTAFGGSFSHSRTGISINIFRIPVQLILQSFLMIVYPIIGNSNFLLKNSSAISGFPLFLFINLLI